MQRDILHITIPSFPIALARTSNPALCDRPVAVAPLHSERALIQCVSPEAAAEGVTAAMPVFKARKICGALVIIPPDPMGVKRGMEVMTEACGEFTPTIEPGAGRIFLDLTGSCKLFGPPRDVAWKLEKTLQRRLGVRVAAGCGINKLVSRIAADVLPEPGVYDVIKGLERHFLAPFPANILPGVGKERENQLLRDLNLRFVHDIASLSLPQLRLAVGAFAPLLHERAMGIDRTPVHPPRKQPEIIEEIYLSEEENDDRIILAELYRLAEVCGIKLRNTGKQTTSLTLSISYVDGMADEKRSRLQVQSILDHALFEQIEKLFMATCRRRVKVRSIKLACSGKQLAEEQLDLFEAPAASVPGGTHLQTALDRLRARYGNDAVHWGRSLRQGQEEAPADAVLGKTGLSAYRYCTLTTRAKR